MRDKKALSDDIWPPIVYVIFLIILIFFFAGYQIYQEKAAFSGINAIMANAEAHRLLLNYLQRNTTFDINNDGLKEKVTFEDLIIFSFLKDEKTIYNYIGEETEKVLIEFKKSDRRGYNIVISLVREIEGSTGTTVKYNDKIKVETYPESKIARLSQSIVHLPLGKNDNYIMLWLKEEGD